MKKKKTKSKRNPNGAGRKLFDGKDEKLVLSKLNDAFDIGASDEEAALHAGISAAALYRYIEKNKEYREEREQRKFKPILKARNEVVAGLDNDKEFSLKYLERKRKKEFATMNKMLHGEDPENQFESLANALVAVSKRKKKKK